MGVRLRVEVARNAIFNVLIATEKDLDPSRGKGVATWARDLRQGLIEAGHRCSMLGRAGGGGTDVFILPAADVRSQARFIATLVEREGFDVVLSASSRSAFAAWPLLPGSCLRIPTVHAALAHTVRREAAAAPMVHCLVGISATVADVLEDVLHGERPVFAIPNGLRAFPEAPGPASAREPVVAVVGRLEVDQKRSHWLPRIWREVLRRVSGARLVAHGDGPEAEWLKEASASSGGSFEVREPVPHEELHRFLARARVLLMTSRYEGLSIAMLEAMAHGMVVVSPSAGEVTAGVLHDRNAILVECSNGLHLTDEDSTAFAGAIVRALSDGVEADRLGAAARVTVEREHTIARMARSYLDLFARVRSWGPVPIRDVVPPEGYSAERSLTGRLFRRIDTGVGTRIAAAREHVLFALTSSSHPGRLRTFC